MTKEELSLAIAECLIEPAYPDDALKQAENMATRLIKRFKLDVKPDSWYGNEEADVSELPNIKPINGLNE